MRDREIFVYPCDICGGYTLETKLELGEVPREEYGFRIEGPFEELGICLGCMQDMMLDVSRGSWKERLIQGDKNASKNV